jgi:hypothetical protein
MAQPTEYLNALLAYLFGEGDAPLPEAYYVRLLDAGGQNPEGEWTNYEPAEIYRQGGFTDPAFSGGTGSVRNEEVLTFCESATLVGVPSLAIHYVELATGAADGLVIRRNTLAEPIIVYEGRPVRVPVGGVIVSLAHAP